MKPTAPQAKSLQIRTTFQKFLVVAMLMVSVPFCIAWMSSWGIDCDFMLAYLIYPVMGLLAIILALASLLMQRRKHNKFALAVAAFSLFAVLAAIPLHIIRNVVWFRFHERSYEQVVSLIESDVLRPEKGHFLVLPPKFANLSVCGSEVGIDRRDNITKVLFFTYRGWLGEIGGYLYRSDDDLSKVVDLADFYSSGYTTLQRKERIRPKWFRIYKD